MSVASNVLAEAAERFAAVSGHGPRRAKRRGPVGAPGEGCRASGDGAAGRAGPQDPAERRAPRGAPWHMNKAARTRTGDL